VAASSSNALHDPARVDRAAIAPLFCFAGILFRRNDRAIFAYEFAKNAQANISKGDLAVLRDAANETLGWSSEELDRLVASGALVEIENE